MLISKEVEIVLNNRTIAYYENLGYHIPRRKDKKGRLCLPKGSKITVKVEHLTPSSHVEVDVKCDYCTKEYKMKYSEYNEKVINGNIQKVACIDCNKDKLKESNLKQYNVEWACTTKDAIKKRKITMVDRYGVEYASQNKELMKESNDNKRKRVCDVYQLFKEKSFIPLFDPDFYENNSQQLPYICTKHSQEVQYTTYANLTKINGCKYCMIENNSKENHYNWLGGISDLSNYLRDKISEWKRVTMKACNYKCVITGERMDVIHHLFGFNYILRESLKELDLKLNFSIKQYAEEELRKIEDKCLELHRKHGLGVCLRKDVHDLFHSKELYGKGNNTPQQFEEFQQRYNNGEFTSLLSAK